MSTLSVLNAIGVAIIWLYEMTKCIEVSHLRSMLLIQWFAKQQAYRRVCI